MPVTKPINLLHSYGNMTPQLMVAEARMHRFSLIFLSLVIAGGLFIGITYMILSQMASRLEEERLTTARQLSTFSTKESMYLALGNRTSRLGAVLSRQNDWGDLLTYVNSKIPKELWTELISSDEQTTTLTFKMDSLALARELVDRFADASEIDHKIRRPQLVNVYIRPTGGVEVSISFIPIFSVIL